MLLGIVLITPSFMIDAPASQSVPSNEAMQARCQHIVKIPTKFCVNVSVACAVTLYDRTLNFGGYPERPLMPGGPGASAAGPGKKFGAHR